MENFLNSLEYVLALEWLVDAGNFWVATCLEAGGEWVNDACVNTDLDRWLQETLGV